MKFLHDMLHLDEDSEVLAISTEEACEEGASPQKTPLRAQVLDLQKPHREYRDPWGSLPTGSQWGVLPVMSRLLPRGVSGFSYGGEQGEEGCPWLCSLESAEPQRPP